MFWGAVLKPDQPYTVKQQKDQQLSSIHLSSATLAPESKGKIDLYAKYNGNEIILGTLTSQQKPSIKLDLYFSLGQDIDFYIRGNGILHLVGYFEPDSSFIDEDEDEEEEQENSK